MKLITEFNQVNKTINDKSLAGLFIGSYLNEKTRTPYRLALKRFYDYLVRNDIQSLNEVTLEVAAEFRAELSLDYSPKTVNMTVATVKEFYKWIKTRLDNTNMMKDSLGLTGKDWINLEILELQNVKVCSREQHTETLTETEVKSLMSTVYNMSDKFQANQFKIMLLILVNAGLRVQELTQLRVSDLKLQGVNYVISITGKGMRKRVISLSKPVTDEIKSILSEGNYHDDHYLMQGHDLANNSDPTKPITTANIWKRIKRLVKIAKLGKDISPHSLRRTCATILYKRSVPIESIQRIMGHDNTHTTQRYIDMEIDMEVSAKYALDLTGEAV